MHQHISGHPHAHPHSEAAEQTADERIVLFEYMLDHFTHHVAEIEEMAEGLDSASEAQARKALELYRQGNEAFAAALKMMKVGE